MASYDPTHRSELNLSRTYKEELSLRRLEALPGWAELAITSKLLTARRPDERQVRYQTVLPIAALLRARLALDQFLTDAPRGSGKYSCMTVAMELIETIPKRTSNPQLAQIFMLDALEKFSEAASKLDVESFNKSEMAAIVSGEQWKQVGFEINSIIRDHIDYVNGLATTAELPAANEESEVMEATGTRVQGQLDEYIERLKAHDYTGETPQDLADMKRRLDPTGEVWDKFDNRSTRH